MNGYLLTFYTQQDRMIHGQSLGDWLVAQAKKLGIHGATLIAGNSGYGHDGQLRSVYFFELTGQPISVMMALSEDDIDKVFTVLNAEDLQVFYTLAPIEFGMSTDYQPRLH